MAKKDAEMEAFCDSLLESVKQMKAGVAARTTAVSVSDVVRARKGWQTRLNDMAREWLKQQKVA